MIQTIKSQLRYCTFLSGLTSHEPNLPAFNPAVSQQIQENYFRHCKLAAYRGAFEELTTDNVCLNMDNTHDIH